MEAKFSETRAFGVEIELVGMDRYGAVQALRAAGINARDEGYTHLTTSYWKVVSDGSLNSGTIAGGTCEVVSPKLYGKAGIVELQTAMNALQVAGAKVNKSCGLHVHHDASDLRLDEVKRLVALYTKAEKVMDEFVPMSRRANSYCRSLVEPYYNKAQNLLDARTWNGLLGLVASIGRYHKLNLVALTAHGTVEFRQHHGTVDGAKAAAWVALTQAMVERSLRPYPLTITVQRMNYYLLKEALGLLKTTDSLLTWMVGYYKERRVELAVANGGYAVAR